MHITKKALLGICVIVLVAGLLSSFMIMYPKQYKDGLTLQDEVGDRSCLKDIEISGVLSDNINQTEFRFVNNKWDNKFSPVTNYNSYKQYNYLNGYDDSSLYPISRICSIDMTDVVPNPNPDHWEGDQNGNKSEAYIGKGFITYSINDTQFSSDVIWSGNMTKYVSGIVSGDNGEYWDSFPFNRKGYVWNENKLYLYTLTDSNCSGYGGVYDITNIYKEGMPRLENSSVDTSNSLTAVVLGPGKIKIDLPNIAPLDLENGKVQILDMVATENKLTYLFLRDEVLYIRPFNLQTNNFENEIELGQIPKNEQVTSKSRGNFTEMFSQGNIVCVAAFSNEILGINKGFYFQGLRCAFYAADIESGTFLQSVMEEPLDYDQISIKNIEILYKNDMLYVLRKYGVMQNVASGKPYTPENRLKISVYKDNKIVYQGNILSGAQEDYKYQFQDPKKEYKTYMRDYYFIGLK